MADIKTQILDSVEKIQKAFYKVSNGRQSTVVSAILMRQKGAVPAGRFLTSFSSARSALLSAASALDEQLDQYEKADRDAWVKILGAFNKASQSIPGVNISSTSVAEIIDLAIPPIPSALFAPVESAASRQAVQMETARYETKRGAGLNGLGQLGFFQPLIGAVTGSTCLAAAAAVGVATAGVGAAVVGAGCLLLAIGAVVATTAIVVTLVKRLPTSAATALAASEALESATSQTTKACKENNLSSADCTELLKTAGKNTKPPEGLFDIPWGMVAAAAGGLALWYFWPVIFAKVRASRATQSVSGGVLHGYRFKAHRR